VTIFDKAKRRLSFVKYKNSHSLPNSQIALPKSVSQNTGQVSAAATKISAASCRHQPTKERAGYLNEIDKQQLQYPGSSWK